MKDEIIIYQADEGTIRLEVKIEDDSYIFRIKPVQ